MFDLLVIEVSIVFLFMTGCYLLALTMKRNDIADIVWGLIFVLAVVTALIVAGMTSPRAILAAVLVFAWGGRLAFRIFSRNLSKKTEDFRYKQWREEWGKYFYFRTFFQIFMLQGILALVVVSPVLLIIASGNGQPPINFLDWLGTAVWLAGFFFEAVGDYQLDVFKKDPSSKNKIMQTGLWKYSRHPNYFGEVTMWWGIYLIALSTPNGYLAFLGPLTITFLILKVSGIPMLEKKYVDNVAFQEYARRTSVFFPLPPKPRKINNA